MSKDMENKEKKMFKMPHLLWIMLGMIIVCSLLTYIIPAGQFATDESGALLGDQFAFLGTQTPVAPWRAFMMFMPGLTGSGSVIFAVMVSGACIQILLDCGTFDKTLDWSIYKLQDRGETLLISILFCIMVYLGAFGGSDALVAIVPIGVVFAKKMKLDNITALAVSFFATMLGFGTGPTKVYVVQGLMGTQLYGAFLSRFIFMNIIMLVGLAMTLSYIRRIKKDPTKSLMYADGWRPGIELEAEGNTGVKEARLETRTVMQLLLFIAQYIAVVAYGLNGGSDLFSFQLAVFIPVACIQGILGGMSADEIGASFAKGLASMAFVCFVIGLARTVSLVLTAGNVLHTIVYFITRPLMALPRWISSVGMMLVIAIINPIIPSATSKAAILVPIIKPVGEVLNLAPEMVVQAFQFGDGFTNLVSPVLGWTMGSLITAKVPFDKWVKWVLPKVFFLLAVCAAIIFVLTTIGWTGTI